MELPTDLRHPHTAGEDEIVVVFWCFDIRSLFRKDVGFIWHLSLKHIQILRRMHSVQFSLPPSPKFPFCLSVFHTCPLCSQCNKDSSEYCLDKAPRLSISIVIWILSSDTICQLNQFHTNGEAATLSNTAG